MIWVKEPTGVNHRTTGGLPWASGSTLHPPEEQPQPKGTRTRGSPRGAMPTLTAGGQGRADKGSFPKEVMPELSQLEKPRTGGNTPHQGRFQSTYTELGV